MFESAHHSADAREMMQAFYVGQYVEVGKAACHIEPRHEKINVLVSDLVSYRRWLEA